jgi:hypothetical protein
VRKGLSLLLMAGALAAILWLTNRTAGLHYVVRGEPGTVLYTAAFTSGSDGWSQFDDGRLSAQAGDGALVLRVNQPDSAAFSTAPYHFADALFSVTASAIDGPIDNGFGLIVGLRTGDNTRLEDDSYLLFLISSDGYYSARKREQGSETTLSTWIASPAIRLGLGQDNHLRAELVGGEARFTVNGEPMQFCVPNAPDGVSTYYLDECLDGTMVDALPMPGAGEGQLGVVALTTATGGPGVTVRFENAVVIAP